VAGVRAPIAGQDFTPFLPKIMEARPDILCLCNFGRDQLYAVRDATVMGLKDKMRLVAPVLLYQQRLTGGAALFDDVIGGSNYHWTLEQTVPAAKRFNDAYRARYDRPPSDYGAYGYAGVSALLSAMRTAGSTDSRTVADTLRTLRYDVCKGQQWYRACDGQSVQSVLVVGSTPEAKMENPHDIFEVLDTQAADEKFLRSCSELAY